MSVTAAPPAFTRAGALALVVGGFALFLAMLSLIAGGQSIVSDSATGQAHAAANGLNGYSGLVRLVEAKGYKTRRSRTRAGLRDSGLVVLTPPLYADPKALATLLEERRSRGPTLVIASKWWTNPPSPRLPPEVREKFKRGWVTLASPQPSDWPAALPAPYTFAHALGGTEKGARPARWSGLGQSGVLPAVPLLHAAPAGPHRTLISDAQGHVLAFEVNAGDAEDEHPYPVAFLVEPDLANNFGLADPARAKAALALIDHLAADGEVTDVTFDMTLNGLGASENLLTLAFRPPFLAATLSMLIALLIVGWRAFRRFGPAAAAGEPAIAFGKRQLIANGAGLILRARRFGLLGAPYAALSARRLAERLSLARPDPGAIDAALARRLPDEEPFSRRAARLEAAGKPADILAGAKALDDLATRLQQGQTSA